MKTVTIDGSLTQIKLAAALRRIAGDRWCGEEAQLPGSKRNWDMALYTPDGIALVEYDGDAHYCDPLRVRIDREKDRMAERYGYRVIHFPYWLQLDTAILAYYFGLSAVILQDFPHGFITTHIFPAAFCEAGVRRFWRELRDLPADVGHAVLHSLRDRAAEHGAEAVLPPELRYLLDVQEKNRR